MLFIFPLCQEFKVASSVREVLVSGVCRDTIAKAIPIKTCLFMASSHSGTLDSQDVQNSISVMQKLRTQYTAASCSKHLRILKDFFP